MATGLYELMKDVPDDPKSLDNFVAKAEPAELLEILTSTADFLYQRVGTPAHWQAVANMVNDSWIGSVADLSSFAAIVSASDSHSGMNAPKEYVELIWEVQKRLDSLHTILFTSKHEDKIRGLYKQITGKKVNGAVGGVEFSIFYNQLGSIMSYVAELLYGQNRTDSGGQIFDFSNYSTNIFNFRYLLAVGMIDWRASRGHSGNMEKEMVRAGTPDGDIHQPDV